MQKTFVLKRDIHKAAGKLTYFLLKKKQNGKIQRLLKELHDVFYAKAVIRVSHIKI